MIEIEGTNYYSKEEIKNAKLHYLISVSVTDNSNSHLTKASLYFDSTIKIESIASHPKFKNGFIKLKGIFDLTIENTDSFNDEYLLLHFTEHSLINDKKVNDKTPLKIKPCEIIFNYIDYPEIYSTIHRNIDKVTSFYTFLPRYFTKNDIKKILKTSRYTKTNPNNLIKEVDLFEPEKEFKPNKKNWYESISDNPEYFYIDSFESESFVTLELLKDYLNKSDFLKIINLTENGLIQPYFYIDTKERLFNFETIIKTYKSINNQFHLKGFLSVKTTKKTKIELQTNQTCFINSIVPKESSFCFSTNEFESLVKYIDIKNKLKIQETYIEIKDSLIENSLLHTQDFYIYFNLNSLVKLSDDFNIVIKKEQLLKEYKSREILGSSQTHIIQSKQKTTENPSQIQSIIDFIIKLNNNNKRKTDNRIILLSTFQKYLEQHPHKNDFPKFEEIYYFIQEKGREIDLVLEAEPKILFLTSEKHINKTAFKKSFERLLNIYYSNIDH